MDDALREATLSVVGSTVRPMTEARAIEICRLMERMHAQIERDTKLRAAARRLKEAADASNQVSMWAAIGEIKSMVKGAEDVVCD